MRLTGESKMWLKNAHSLTSTVEKWKPVTHHRYTAISQKLLKIDGYMLHWILFRSMKHETWNIYRDCPRSVPRRPKCAKNVLKWRTMGWISWKWLKIDGYMLRCFDKHWILFLSMWHLPRLSQGRNQGRPKSLHIAVDNSLLITTELYVIRPT